VIRPTPRCRNLLLELSRYLDGDLTPARRRMVERHVNACACCETMAARLRRMIATCRAEGKRRLPQAVKSRAEKRITALVARDVSESVAIGRRRRSTTEQARR
jgi:anti-sigma factor RsiW